MATGRGTPRFDLNAVSGRPYPTRTSLTSDTHRLTNRSILPTTRSAHR